LREREKLKKKLWLCSVLVFVIILLSGCSVISQLTGKTDLMLDYLEKTDHITNEYIMLLNTEAMIEDPAELISFTEEELLPRMSRLMNEARELIKEYDEDELIELHGLLISSYDKLIQGNEAWLAEDYDTTEQLLTESDELYAQYEEDLDQLASKWGVEIEWEDVLDGINE
jgi:hypothetical protein